MTKHSKLLIIALYILFTFCSCSHQQNKSIERKQLFDFDWKFHLGDFPTSPTEGFNDKDWKNLDLPHDWSIEGKIDKENSTGNDGGYFPAGIGWYSKSFLVPSEWKDKQISIYFEGVYTNSEVFINGESLGVRPYGYSSFIYDLSPYLKFNQDNLLSVRVNNLLQKNSRWYSGSGIYRHVWLLVTEQVRIANWGVDIKTLQISAEEAIVEINTKIENNTDSPQNLILSTQVSDLDGKNLNDNETSITIEPNSKKEVAQNITVKKPLLWTPESPNLYKAKIKVLQDNQIIDKTEQKFGIRSIDFSSEKGFLLNGKSVLLNGGSVHHDNGCLGAVAYDRAEERKVELLKLAGFNAVRTAHNPPSEAFLDACDRLGLLVIDEAFDGWKLNKTTYDYANYFEEWSKMDIQDMVLRDRNHPSIILWSTGNEIIERKAPEAIETAKMLADAVRQIDSTRPITSAMTTWDNDWDIFDPLMAEHDVCGYNYQLDRATSDHERVPSRIIVNTESYPINAFKIWDMVSENNYIIGDFVWTAMDYLGESGIGGYYYPNEKADEHWESERYPWHGAYCGDIDLIGWRKPISHYRSMLYNTNENLYMAVREPNPKNGKIKLTRWAVWPTWESWTWPNNVGKNIQVEVYSKYPSVRLFLNNELISEKQTGKEEEFKATFTLPYSNGILKAVAYDNDVEKDSVILKSAGKAEKIRLKADRTKIWTNGQDLSYVTVEITDKNGTINPNAENSLSFSVDGPGMIVGVDNANLKDSTSYVNKTRNAWHGRALVIIKSTKEAGEIVLKAESPDLDDTTLSIHSIRQEHQRENK
jgi:beta-galactosidase